ncbi:MAG TPA: dockerin type I domain-containing protein [Lacipirellula sp.]
MSQLIRYSRRLLPAFVLLLSAAAAERVHAAVDAVQIVVDENTATGGSNAISGVGYNPLDDSIYVSSFGAGGALRKVTNLGGTPTSTIIASEGQIQLFYRDGDVTRGVISPMQSGIVLNPQPLGSGPGAIGAYELAVIADAARTTYPESHPTPTAIDPTATKRFYSYNLGTIPPGGDGRDIFTTITTLADIQAASGSLSTSSNQGRSFAWSGDGQSLYYVDTGNPSTAHGGLWKLNPRTGALTRLVADDFDAEPAVVASGQVDLIYVDGQGSTGNDGGVDRVTYDGLNVGARAVALSAADFRTFLDAPATYDPDVDALAADAAGNLYIGNGTSSGAWGGIYRLDTEGRLSKVMNYAERDLALSTDGLGGEDPNANILRMTPRTYTHPTAGAITQIIYAESSPLNLVAGANVFEVGDFNRDGAVSGPDLAMFGAALSTRGTALAGEDNYKFDLNGNNAVDWKDVKVLQSFVEFPTGDVNFDSVLELIDLDVLGANYYTTASPTDKTWVSGDLGSVDPLYAADAVDANLVNEVDVELFAGAWLNDLQQPISESQLTSRGYGGQFLEDVLAAFGFATAESGDFDDDGDVDGSDFLAWQRGLGSSVTPGTGADGNSDGTVDGDDLAIWKDAVGSGTATIAAAVVPEPAGVVMALVAMGMALANRRGLGSRF